MGSLLQMLTHFHYGTLVEIFGKQIDVDRGRHKNDFQIFSLCDKTLDDAKNEIGEEMPFVYFIDDQNIVIGQRCVGLNLSEENT
jgi:hypothetical protein